MSVRARLIGALVSTAALLGLVTTAAVPASAVGSAVSCQVNPDQPKRQIRAMWIASVVNIDWPSRPGLPADTVKDEYRGWLDLAVRLHFNAVIVQVRPTADAFWPSPYEPWSEWLTGVRGADPGWDPLAFLVAEAHARNLEFHAWFNPYRISMPAPNGAGPDLDKLAPSHPARQHPDWAIAYPVNAAGSRLYYNPGLPDVRRFVQNAMMDAVTRYDLDGVHFDDYFYPYPAAGQDFADDATYARFGAGFATKADWRRDNINRLVQEMSVRIKAVKPWVKFGISPFGIWRNKATDPLGSDTNGLQSYDAISADTRRWVKEEWIDYIVPQVYWYLGFAVADYAKLVPWWNDVVAGTRVQLYIGQADYRVGSTGPWLDPAELDRHLAFNQGYPGVAGNVHFCGRRIAATTTSLYATRRYSRPALVPTTPHLPSRPLLQPFARAHREAGGVALDIRTVLDRWPFGRTTSYAIYRFDGLTGPGGCGLADAAHLIGTVRKGRPYLDTTAQPGRPYTYYVTALDRLANESGHSPPAFVH